MTKVFVSLGIQHLGLGTSVSSPQQDILAGRQTSPTPSHYASWKQFPFFPTWDSWRHIAGIQVGVWDSCKCPPATSSGDLEHALIVVRVSSEPQAAVCYHLDSAPFRRLILQSSHWLCAFPKAPIHADQQRATLIHSTASCVMCVFILDIVHCLPLYIPAWHMIRLLRPMILTVTIMDMSLFLGASRCSGQANLW